MTFPPRLALTVSGWNGELTGVAVVALFSDGMVGVAIGLVAMACRLASQLSRKALPEPLFDAAGLGVTTDAAGLRFGAGAVNRWLISRSTISRGRPYLLAEIAASDRPSSGLGWSARH